MIPQPKEQVREKMTDIKHMNVAKIVDHLFILKIRGTLDL